MAHSLSLREALLSADVAFRAQGIRRSAYFCVARDRMLARAQVTMLWVGLRSSGSCSWVRGVGVGSLGWALAAAREGDLLFVRRHDGSWRPHAGHAVGEVGG